MACTGRAFPWNKLLIRSICALDAVIGSRNITHFTPCVQGGVVSDPS
jgi:hypothetical protein